MTHDFKNSETGLSGGKLFDAASHGDSANIGLTPDLISKPLENPGFEVVPGIPPYNVVAVKNHDRIPDELLIRTWLSGKSKNTKRAYGRTAEEFLAWIHPTGLRGASIYQIQSFVEARSGQKSATRALRTAATKSLFTYGHRTGYLPANLGAFITGVKCVSRLTERYLTVEEVGLMCSRTENLRDHAILKLLYNAGLRVSELVALNWVDMQPREDDGAQFMVRGKGEKERVVRISKGAWDALQSLRTDVTRPFDAVFSSDYGDSVRLTDRTVRDIVFRAGIRAGILKRVSPHFLRHAHASHALDNGAPIHLVQQTLGHASLATTSKYLHARPNESSGSYLPD